MKEEVLRKLKELQITYKLVEHIPVYTITEINDLGNIFENAMICKNLFLRDQKGKRHFLVVMPENKKVSISEIASKIESTKLSFASEKRLMKYLKLTPGAVSPLAVINDENNMVEVILDEDLKKENLLGVHPCVNTSTVLITPDDLEKYISSVNNKLKYIKI